ncbi:hypothetical protein SAZ10_29445 [Mesorhizobium sp. BAC0120]|uniref:hypothetical protein n=1 Tax=Mesorhizobium sp. BAC0120 TaxID=3090670 RepID=UPI00298C9936|nr:hypothetical protein [Mesorhizobium sp. BAC0120]MDW6025892.1 hypothetical protein [Mesorhizobium sp. BAC0120]
MSLRRKRIRQQAGAVHPMASAAQARLLDQLRSARAELVNLEDEFDAGLLSSTDDLIAKIRTAEEKLAAIRAKIKAT